MLPASLNVTHNNQVTQKIVGLLGANELHHTIHMLCCLPGMNMQHNSFILYAHRPSTSWSHNLGSSGLAVDCSSIVFLVL